MRFNQQNMLDSIKNDLLKATRKQRHRFRYFSMATCGLHGHVRQRMLVLREVADDFTLTAYTDSRSKKITHIKENSEVSLLFFDPRRFVQISITAKAAIEKDEKTVLALWDQIKPRSRKDYITELPPGTVIPDPSGLEHQDNVHYFTVLRLFPEKIEYVKLQKIHHLRILFVREGNSWSSNYLVP
ncbi:pyridoxamine 5'-phosphate oxidase family protein [Sinomicrobium weinanense]|uniref:Pyridoxamine 5'-phosphate oxidase family protein n=1 Tax=Sinomicrobium weinanense TaxID=2842200 RepID=A0A926JQB3_9FLAO|nr:pyridoxamine 5'-phosphate oxidase family protein [Sinomicrobium weinanense]MBC9795291.1 pyridoxamine 5'-phosphate oxidase family protein [Sinomicrobium weinanense]MBU3125763.1 pyridoxamine 5'-phosphate oxidase family protein [Sinomicrobium weinanense]